MKKIIASVIMAALLVVCGALTAFAMVDTGSEGTQPASDNAIYGTDVPNLLATPETQEQKESVVSGAALAILAIAVATILPGIGSALGVRLTGQATNGLLSENPTMFGKALVLEVLPMTQGIYGMVTSFMIMTQVGLVGGAGSLSLADLTVKQGMCFLFASLPIAFVGLFSAIYQAKSAVSGIALIGKRSDKVGPAMTSAALVETYAIFALLISLLAVFNFGAAFAA